MMQREKIMAALLASYMGMVVVSVWSDSIMQFFAGKTTIANTWIAADASPSTVKIALFLIIVAVVAAKADIAVGRDSSMMAPIEVLLYSFITGVLIAGTVFKYLPDATQTSILAQTRLVHYLKDYYTLWLVAPIGLILFVTSRRKSWFVDLVI